MDIWSIHIKSIMIVINTTAQTLVILKTQDWYIYLHIYFCPKLQIHTFILFILSVRYIMVLQFMLQKYVLHYMTEIRNEKRVASKRTVYHIALDILKDFHCTLTYVCIILFAFHIFTCRVTYRLLLTHFPS